MGRLKDTGRRPPCRHDTGSWQSGSRPGAGFWRSRPGAAAAVRVKLATPRHSVNAGSAARPGRVRPGRPGHRWSWPVGPARVRFNRDDLRAARGW